MRIGNLPCEFQAVESVTKHYYNANDHRAIYVVDCPTSLYPK
jgi:hypothetical protein